jgi:hypothetical protein
VLRNRRHLPEAAAADGRSIGGVADHRAQVPHPAADHPAVVTSPLGSSSWEQRRIGPPTRRLCGIWEEERGKGEEEDGEARRRGWHITFLVEGTTPILQSLLARQALLRSGPRVTGVFARSRAFG